MLISEERPSVIYLYSSQVKEYPITFTFIAARDIHVAVEEPGEFARALAPNEYKVIYPELPTSSGHVELITTFAAGTTIEIYRRTAQQQQFKYIELDSFPAASHEQGLTTIVMMVQELNTQLDKAITVPPGSAETPVDLLNRVLIVGEEAEASAQVAQAAVIDVVNAAAMADISATQAAASAAEADIPTHNISPDAHRELFENIKVFPEVDPGLVGKPLALVPQADGTFQWQPVGSGEPVGKISWMPALTPPTGYLALSNDNGLLVRSGFEALWAEAQRSGLLRTEAEWQAEFAAKGSVGFYSSGDGSMTFRVPLLRRVFLRSNDPKYPELSVGQYQGDASRRIKASWVAVGVTSSGTASTGAAGVEASATGGGTTSAGGNKQTLTFDSGLVVPTAEENRPVAMVLLPILKAFDTIVPPSDLVLADAFQQLVEINNLVNSEAHIRRLAGKRDKPTPWYKWTPGTPLIVPHGLTLTPDEVRRASVRVDCRYIASPNVVYEGVVAQTYTTAYVFFSEFGKVTETDIEVPTPFGNNAVFIAMGNGTNSLFTAANSEISATLFY